MNISSKQTYLIISLLFLILSIETLLVGLLVFKTGGLERQEKKDHHEHPLTKKGHHEHPPTRGALKTEFKPPQKYDLNSIYRKLERDCSNNLSCFEKALIDVTETYGPVASLESLRMLQENGRISRAADDHHIAHEIGMKTAERFGINGQAFLLCPTSFNYGCQHGFFQNALGKAGTSEKAATLICGSLDNSYSSKFKFYCYHGLGHGVLMAQDYDLTKALTTCDAIDNVGGQDGCWQGVFMENVNAAITGDRRAVTFSKTDPLAPCNKVDTKYRWECFINHSGYLMKFFKNSMAKAAAACLKAGEFSSACLQSLGLLTTNPSWQASITGQGNFAKNIETALQLCDQFPAEARNDCFIGALDNILNYDGMDLGKRALKFCQSIPDRAKEICYKQIGINIARQVVDVTQRRNLCERVASGFRNACLVGASISHK